MMLKTNSRLKIALAGLLFAGCSSVYGDQQSPAVHKLPDGLSVGANGALPAFAGWGMIDDPLIGLANQPASLDNRSKKGVWEHWVQLVPQTELSAPTTDSLPAEAKEDTIKIVLPIATEEGDTSDSELPNPLERNIRGISLDITAPAGSMPPNPAASRYESNPVLSSFEPRPWQEEVFFWESPVFCHRPLYFEEQRLERDGQVRFPMIRPAISGAHFFASCATLPYQAVMYPPCECVPSSQPSSLRLKHPSTLGHRDFKATVAQTATVAGLILLVP